MLVEGALLLVGELAVGVDRRRVLDPVLGVLDLDVLPRGLGARKRNEVRLRPEEARVDQPPFGLTRVGVDVDPRSTRP